MTPRRITPPPAVVTLAEAKAWLRVDGDDEDALIATLVEAAVAHMDGWTGVLGRALGEQVWELALDAFPAAEIALPLGPVVRVEQVGYVDPAGASRVVSPDDYVLDAQSVEGWVVPVEGVAWPETMDTVNAVRVRWTCGAGCPAPVRVAILMLVAHWHANREAVGPAAQELPLGVSMAIENWRRAPG